MQFSNTLSEIESCANILKTLQQQGISAIPLNGKRPHHSIKWKQYQFALPRSQVIEDWSKQSIVSYGVICGRISAGIFVIDFDCIDLYENFVKTFSTLANTYTVQTRRGFHVYLKSEIPVPSRRFANCDIKGEGGYVVGAGSVVDDYQYQITKSTAIQSLTYKCYRQLLDWLTKPSEKQQQMQLPQLTTSDPVDDYVLQYDQRIAAAGRNNALFHTAMDAHRNGYTIKQTIELLATHHAKTKPINQHKSETSEQRLKEAIRTITSAYKVDLKTSITHATKEGLPNIIRETFLKKQKSTIVPRILDAIHMFAKDKQWMTLGELIQLCKKLHIGKKSIISVLTGKLAKINGSRIFKQIRYHDYKVKNASQGDKGTPNSRLGRRTQFIYKIPTVDELSQILRVSGWVSDSLQIEDLYSAAAYRRALHRELIRRLSPMIRVDWYANRLGVHRRTIFRYNMQIGVLATPMISKEKLTREMIPLLATNDNPALSGFTPGLWLETKSGKRYPALQEIANNLVADDSDFITLCRQLPTRYRMPDLRTAKSVELPDHLKSRGHLLTYSTVHEILPPDWATDKYELGGYLAIYNGYEWEFRPPRRVIAYPLVQKYEDGLVYFIRPLKPER